MTFKLYDCDVGIKVAGVNYEFEHVVSIAIEDPERNRLTRGTNGKSKLGIAYKEGMRDAKTWTVPIMGMSKELKAVLDSAFENKTRLDVYAIQRSDGSSKMAKNAILSQQPKQLTLDEGAESVNVSLVFETFDDSEVHKS